MPSLNDIREIAGYLNVAIPVIVAVAIFFLCLKFLDELILLKSLIAGLFTKISSRARKSHISNQIRGNARKAVKTLNLEKRGLLPTDIKIEWVKDEDKDSFIKNNQVIIRMRQSTNPYENFVNAVMSFVSAGLMEKERIYFSKKIMQAADISIVKKLIVEASQDSLAFFNNKVIGPLLDNDDELRTYINDIAAIDDNAMFINIMLNEFSKVGKKIFPAFYDPGLAAEANEFLGFLFRAATTIYRSPEELTFNREYFRVAIMMPGKDETLAKQGIRPYIKGTKKSISAGVETFYVFGLGKKITVAKGVAKAIAEEDIRVIDCRTHHYKHKSTTAPGIRIDGVCIEITVRKA